MELMTARGKVEDGCPTIPSGGEDPLRVVGDVHGQLDCLLHCILGPVLRAESPRCSWLFLGDLVDRGSHGVECLQIISLMRVCWPSRVMVIRGNHEDAPVTYVYGFWRECDSKYPSPDSCAAWYAANLAFV